MIPDKSHITISNNEELIKQFIDEIIVQSKKTLKKWSFITRQTPSFKIGYTGQHLASLITGVVGRGSGARGDDLSDGTEVKSCNKIDQLDKCKDCGESVLRYENECPYCHSTRIERKKDSKWLFSVRSEQELEQYLNLNRILLLIMDYPGFDDKDYKDIRISAFEIYPKDPRCKAFNFLIKNHYYNIYLKKIEEKGKANPMNLHPYMFQFYMCNPTMIFECIIKDIEGIDPKINITNYVKPTDERKGSIEMPSNLLKPAEWQYLDYNLIKKVYTDVPEKAEFDNLNVKKKMELVPFISEEMRNSIPLRPIISGSQNSQYQRH